MKKPFVLLAVLIFTLILMTGCASKGKNNDDDNNAFIGVQLNTDPAGATIYLDGTNLFRQTPELIEPEILIPSEHHIRLYLDTFNEINIFFTYEAGDGLTYEYQMEEPQSPLPMFDITSPVEGQSFDDNVIILQGIITMEDRSPFPGDQAILNMNGTDWLVNVVEGIFDEDISIGAGVNEIWMRANSENGDTGVSDLVTVYGDFTAPNIEVVLTWNTPTSDLDLHIWNPAGEHCFFDNMFITEGSLDIDETEGFGPETFTAPDAMLGTYVVSVNSFSLDEDAYADATVQLLFQGSLYDIYGPHHFTAYDYNGSDPESWWEVVEFTVAEGRITRNTQPVSEEIRNKIKADMQNLGSK